LPFLTGQLKFSETIQFPNSLKAHRFSAKITSVFQRRKAASVTDQMRVKSKTFLTQFSPGSPSFMTPTIPNLISSYHLSKKQSRKNLKIFDFSEKNLS